jgi:DNA-binding transcriptional regulator YiaG
MSTFTNNTWFHVETCCNCHVQFAMTEELYQRRLKDRNWFYCPNGHSQHYTGPTEVQKLRSELERKQEMLNAATARANSAQQQKNSILKAHRKMRVRVMNGVCPCCNRTFQNLMSHMKTQHPDFVGMRSLLVLRTAFGMSQQDVAHEAGVTAPYVSMYERQRPVPPYARSRLDAWIEEHGMRDDDAVVGAE